MCVFAGWPSLAELLAGVIAVAISVAGARGDLVWYIIVVRLAMSTDEAQLQSRIVISTLYRYMSALYV